MFTINPYVVTSLAGDVWVFDDPSVGLVQEGLVAGIDDILTIVASGRTHLQMQVSSESGDIADPTVILCYVCSSQDFVPGETWHAYMSHEMQRGGWLCPHLLLYFDAPPKQLYIKIA